MLMPTRLPYNIRQVERHIWEKDHVAAGNCHLYRLLRSLRSGEWHGRTVTDPHYLVKSWIVLTRNSSIILRAFQGVGASGIFSIIMTLAPTLISLNQYGKYMAIFSTLFIVANVLGPVLGGVISQHSDWRWVFLLKLVVKYLYHDSKLLMRHL